MKEVAFKKFRLIKFTEKGFPVKLLKLIVSRTYSGIKSFLYKINHIMKLRLFLRVTSTINRN